MLINVNFREHIKVGGIGVLSYILAGFIVGVTLASLFVWSLVEGFTIHTTHTGNNFAAMIYYFSAWLAGVAALFLYLEAKLTFRYAKLSK